MDLALVWAVLLAFVVLTYVILDGFDLGIGILFPFFTDKSDRDVMMNSVAPVWDGNETWLILGGGGLFAAFPLAYAILMPALYPLIIAMLLGLVFRGVSFEFRFKTSRQFLWNWGFAGGSIVAAVSQGMMLGAILQEPIVDGRAYDGGWFDWVSPFTLFCGFALLVGYTLLGTTWLIMKTSGDIQKRCFRMVHWPALGLIACIGIVSIWLPLRDEAIADVWFTFPQAAVYWLIPMAVALLSVAFYIAVHRGNDVWPYWLSLGLFVVAFTGFGVTIFPYVVPRSVTIWDAAATDSSLMFLLVGVVILIPMIITYTGYAYWVFRGKVDPNEGYH
jgi:cytochrome bd ubiquinol oxidase subunit II